MSEVNELCKLVERVSEIDYKSKTQSVISVCDRGTGNEQLNYPYGVTVDHNTCNIYVADNCNNCVKVFDNTAKYLLKFGDGKGEGKMSSPRGLLIRGNKVFVSHSDCILVPSHPHNEVNVVRGMHSRMRITDLFLVLC